MTSRKEKNSGTPNMLDVARVANVSPATVSRVLSGSGNVRPEFRKRVLAAAAEVDYRGNRLARNLRRQKVDMIGILVSDIENPHFSEAVRVFEDAAFRAGYRVLLCNTDETPEKQRAYLEVLAQERVVGAIVSPVDSRGAGIEALLDLGIPIVAFDRVAEDPRADAVVGDNLEATRRATEHLIWLGHKRIAFVGGRPDVETGAERLEGYLDAMRVEGLTPFTINGGFRIDIAEREAKALLKQPSPPTALVVANNLMTIGVLRAVRAAGLSIPSDIALVAVDDPPWAEFTDPPLTTVAQPVRRMAEMAIELLLARIAGRHGEPERIVLPLELRIRASCGMRVQPSEGKP